MAWICPNCSSCMEDSVFICDVCFYDRSEDIKLHYRQKYFRKRARIIYSCIVLFLLCGYILNTITVVAALKHTNQANLYQHRFAYLLSYIVSPEQQKDNNDLYWSQNKSASLFRKKNFSSRINSLFTAITNKDGSIIGRFSLFSDIVAERSSYYQNSFGSRWKLLY